MTGFRFPLPLGAIPAPRLLPLTIGVIGIALVLRCVTLVQSWPRGAASASIAMVASAHASAPEAHGPEKHEAAKQGAETKAGGHPVAEPPAPAPTLPPEPPPITASERAILLDLRQRRDAIDTRDAAVSARESLLKAAEQKLTTRVDELRALQQRLESLDAVRQQKEDASWQGLVKLYEAMKPHEAATIYNELAMSVLLPLVAHMKEAKAAPIMAAMNPDKARELTAQLAKTRNRPEPPAEPSQPKPKG